MGENKYILRSQDNFVNKQLRTNKNNHTLNIMMNWSPCQFVKRHKRKIVVGGVASVVVGGAVGVGYYTYRQRSIQADEQKRMMSQRMRYLYEENRKTVDMALRALLPKV
jgi:hypothetical protein